MNLDLICQVIANIPRAQKEGRIPIVFFGHRCCYWTEGRYQQADNVWEYYFEPLHKNYPSSCIPKSVVEAIRDRFPDPESIGYLCDNVVVTNNYGDHSSLKEMALAIPFKKHDPSLQLRIIAGNIVSEYIRPRDYIEHKVAEFVASRFQNRHVVGIHLRGTDSNYDPRWHLRVRANTQWFIDAIEGYILKQPDAIFFLATDEQPAVDVLLAKFPDRIITYDSIRHAKGNAVGAGPEGNIMPAYIASDSRIAAKNGEEAVIESQILRHCCHLIHNNSSLARFVLICEPKLQDTSFMAERLQFEDSIKRLKKQRSAMFYNPKPFSTLVIQSFNQADNVIQTAKRVKESGADEVIVCEDGSIDGSMDLWLQELNRRNDFIISSNDLHEIRTYDRAIAMSKSEIVCLAQDDDIFPSDNTWFRQSMKMFDRYPNLAVVGGWCGYDDWFSIGWNSRFHNTVGVTKFIDPVNNLPFQFVENVNIGPYFLRKSIYEKLGGFDFSYSQPGEPGICFESEYCYRAWSEGFYVALLPMDFNRNSIVGGSTQWDLSKRNSNVKRNKELIHRCYESISQQIKKRVSQANQSLAIRIMSD